MEDTRQKRETWYDNGQLSYRANWKNGELDGLQEEWYENGKLKYRANWKNGWKVPLPPHETTLYNNQKI